MKQWQLPVFKRFILQNAIYLKTVYLITAH